MHVTGMFNGDEADGAQNTSFFPNTPARKLLRQATDSWLLDKYAMPKSWTNSAAPSSVSPSQSTGSTYTKPPMTLPDVRQWLSSPKKPQAASNTPAPALGRPSHAVPLTGQPNYDTSRRNRDLALALFGQQEKDDEKSPPSNLIASPLSGTHSTAAADPSHAIKRLFDAASKLSLDQGALNDLLARSGSTSSRSKDWTPALRHGQPSAERSGRRAQVPTILAPS